jgi:trans-2,3-dihydro-3-hydroxyanthranilate isomerase
MGYEYLIMDVFKEEVFGGNQLAVLPDARGLSGEEMQAIAREFNFAESTFVLPPETADGTRRVRIFTPKTELRFAGHPTVGTAAALAQLGALELTEETSQAVFEEGVGPVRVDIDAARAPTFARLTLPGSIELPSQAPDRGAVASALSLPPASIRDCWNASVGIPFVK